MARVRHSAVGEVRERVGLGTAVTEYQVPKSKPADVVNKSVDPGTLRDMSNNLEEQGQKIAVGLLVLLVTWLLTGFVAVQLYEAGVEPGVGLVFGTYAGALALLGTISWSEYNNRNKSNFEQATWVVAATAILLMLVSVWNGTEGRTAMIILAFCVAACNPWGLSKLVAGMRGWNDTRSAREALYVNETTVYTSDHLPARAAETLGVYDDQADPVLVAVRSNGSLVFPAVGGVPFMVRQVKDFCDLGMKEVATQRGPGSGLAREAMINHMIGPRNGTVPGRPVSYMKVTRAVYDAVIAGLYATGLVIADGKNSTKWAKIKEGTRYECGYSDQEILTALLQHSSQSVAQ